MIEILNKFHIDCACLGNHDFGNKLKQFFIKKKSFFFHFALLDFGLDVLMTHIENSNFPWLISNAFDAYTKKPLGNVKDKHIIEKDGLKVGLIGLVEFEWITTLSNIDSDDILYESYIDAGKRLAQELKEKHVTKFTAKI